MCHSASNAAGVGTPRGARAHTRAHAHTHSSHSHIHALHTHTHVRHLIIERAMAPMPLTSQTRRHPPHSPSRHLTTHHSDRHTSHAALRPSLHAVTVPPNPHDPHDPPTPLPVPGLRDAGLGRCAGCAPPALPARCTPTPSTPHHRPPASTPMHPLRCSASRVLQLRSPPRAAPAAPWLLPPAHALAARRSAAVL